MVPCCTIRLSFTISKLPLISQNFNFEAMNFNIALLKIIILLFEIID